MTLARATVALLVALLLAVAAMAYWLDRRGAKRPLGCRPNRAQIALKPAFLSPQ